jgi:hypothetical protein
MGDQSDKSFAERMRDAYPDWAKNSLFCSHLENGEMKTPERKIGLGDKRELILCGYCSGLLVETILKEFGKRE